MSDSDKKDRLLKRSMQAIRVLQEKLERYERVPLAVIGMACRFPGGSFSPEAFWELLREGRDGITEIPGDRWDAAAFYDPDPAKPGKMYVDRAGFLQEGVAAFDARFFGISPREAIQMDPQQRLLLEVSWEAMERAGVANSSLKGSRTGVFVGITGSEYGMLPRELENVDPYTITGSAPNIASGRISHTFGLHGPAYSIDTACSSSLVSIALACHSLRNGECDMALAGGVGVMAVPYPFVILCKMNALARDGKCKTFDARGDGYVRAEGCGMVVLKTLPRALADHDPILAVIKGFAVNHDGFSSGLTVPNGPLQQALIRQALENAGVSPGEVSFLETHGTGTSLGDPIEVQVLANVFAGQRSPDNPLVLGAVKSNIGHLEAAAGIAGLIKVVLCLQHRQIPPNLHLQTINPRINLERIPATIPTKVQPWNSSNRPRVAGVSSFGFSGTNAHVIVAEPPKKESPTRAGEPERPLHILAISAQDESALKESIRRHAGYLETLPESELPHACYTANACRTHFALRMAFIAADTEQMRLRLNGADLSTAGKVAEGSQPLLAFIFNGRKADVEKTAGVLYRTQPLFREEFEYCVGLFQSYVRQPLSDLLTEGASIPDQATYEACAFSALYGVARLWESWGIRPAAVFGVGVGEYAAAFYAGIMELETAVKYAARWAGLLAKDSEITGSISGPKNRYISADTGEPADINEITDPAYWRQHSPSDRPMLDQAIQNLSSRGYQQFVEIGTGRGNLWEDLLNKLSALYCAGVDIDWQGFDRGYSRSKLLLPTYPFQRRRYWLEPFKDQQGGQTPPVRETGDTDTDLLSGRLVLSPLEDKQFEYRLNDRVFPALRDNQNVLHVGYYLEMIGRIVGSLYNTPCFTLEAMEIKVALFFEEEKSRTIHVVCSPRDKEEKNRFRFFSKGDEQNSWAFHAQGCFYPNKPMDLPEMPREKQDRIRKRCGKECTGEVFYRRMKRQGFILGESVRWVDHAWYREGEVLARFRKIRRDEDGAGPGFRVQPGIFDACAQLFLLAGAGHLHADDLFMLVKLGKFVFDSRYENEQLWIHLVLEDSLSTDGNMCGEYLLFNEKGNFVARAEGITVKILDRQKQEEMARVMGAIKDSPQGQEVSELLAELISLIPAEQKRTLQDYLRRQIAAILRMDISEVDVNEKLMTLGVDSLVGVELKRTIDRDMNTDFPLEYIYETPSIKELAETLTRFIPGQLSGDMDRFFCQERKMDIDHWLAFRQENPRAKARIFCFPYGVRGASLYRDWQEKLPDFIEVCPIQFPGKENRLRERPVDDLQVLLDSLDQVLTPLFDRPFAFYGHSGGAFFAYRLAYRLWQQSVKELKHVFVGGFTSPVIWPNPGMVFCKSALKYGGFDILPGKDELAKIDSAKRRQVVSYFGALFEGMDMPDEAKKTVENQTLDEYKLMDGYTPDGNEPPFDIPITAFHGDKDRVVSELEMRAWRGLTTGPFHIHVLPGTHLFIHADEAQEELLVHIVKELEAYR